MAESIKNDFAQKAPKLIKLLTEKLTYLKESEGPKEKISSLLNEAKEELDKNAYNKSQGKIEEANGYLMQT